MKKRRADSEIERMIKECHDRAGRMAAAGRHVDLVLARSIEQALEWTLGEDNVFGTMAEALKALALNDDATAKDLIAKAKAARQAGRPL